MQRRGSLTNPEVAEYQKEALCLIASFVRGHRADPSGTEIFANLLVEDGDDLVVVARNQDHRNPGARYPKEGMLAWGAILSGNAVCVGDIKKCIPSEASTKPYRSIMAIPVMGEDRILGVVSIDSTRPHHFDAELNDLERYLAPYVCLLGWSITALESMIDGQAVAQTKGRTQ
jgi:GAF domain-containing protein